MNIKIKKTIVLVHGLGLGRWIFDEHYVPFFKSKGYEVVVVDLPEHRLSSSKTARQRLSISRCVEHVKQQCSEIAGGFVLIGMSLGGGICQHIASSSGAPENLKAVVLLSSVAPINGLIFSLRMCQRMAKSDPNVLSDFFCNVTNERLVFAPYSLKTLSAKQITNYVDKILPNFSLLEYEVFFQDLFKSPVEISVPLCVIGGEGDALFPPEVTRFIGSYYNVDAHILPDLGHMIPIEPNNNNSLNLIEHFLLEHV